MDLRIAAPGASTARRRWRSKARRPGHSSGEAMATMERLAAQVLEASALRGRAVVQRAVVGGAAPAALWLSVLVVFLCFRRCMKAGRYRSPCCWWMPLVCLVRCLQRPAAGCRTTFIPGRFVDDDRAFGKKTHPDIQFALGQMEHGIETGAGDARGPCACVAPDHLMTSLAFAAACFRSRLQRCRLRQPERDRHGRVGGMIAATLLGLLFVPLFSWCETDLQRQAWCMSSPRRRSRRTRQRNRCPVFQAQRGISVFANRDPSPSVGMQGTQAPCSTRSTSSLSRCS